MKGAPVSKRTRQPAVRPPSLDIGNVIAAFSEEQVTKITGLAKTRLRYWARTGFFKPSFIDEDQRFPFSRIYSFKDVVALRTLEKLRVENNVTLQHLRKVAETLSHLKDDLWTKTTLFIHNRQVAFTNAETGEHPRDALTGQYLLGVSLKRVIDDTSADIISLTARQAAQVGKVSRNRAVAKNSWVIAGTRIPVAAIRRLREDGFSSKQIIEEYPGLTEQDIQAALKHKESEAA